MSISAGLRLNMQKDLEKSPGSATVVGQAVQHQGQIKGRGWRQLSGRPESMFIDPKYSTLSGFQTLAPKYLRPFEA